MAGGKTAWDSCYQVTVHVSFADGIALNTTTMFLYQKLIDRSTLRQGFQIPVEFHHLLKAMPGAFTESMNNDTSNIIILSPSYHRIIHKAKPVFDRQWATKVLHEYIQKGFAMDNQHHASSLSVG